MAGPAPTPDAAGALPASALLPPPPALADCVRAYIWRDLRGAPPATPRDTRVPASPYPGILWLTHGCVRMQERAGRPVDEPLPPITLSGAHRHAYHSCATPGGNFFCLAFQPGALGLLTGLDLSALTDQVADARDHLPGDWHPWLQAMASAPDHGARQALCRDFLAPRWAAVAHQHAPWREVLTHHWSREARQALAAVLGWTPRHLQRRVRQLTGLRPGEVERMLRTERALLAMRDADASALEAALLTGYADQAHFSREARALYERPPTALRQHARRKAQDADWLLRSTGE